MAVTPQTNVTIAELASRLLEHDDFVLCGHVSPDGDCIGSQLALMHALRAIGKRANCVFAEEGPVERGLQFLPGSDGIVPAADYAGPCETFVACDVPTVKRIGNASALHEAAKTHFTIDHHAVDSCMADYNYVDPDAPAVGLIMWQLIAELGVSPSTEMASCCYVALMTDTGRFQFQNTTAECFKAAGEMLECGVDIARCSTEVYQRRSFASLHLESVALANLKVAQSGAWAMSHLRLSDFDECGGVKSDAEPLIDIVRSLDGIQVACMLREQGNVVRGSLRAKGDDLDVSALARRFDGGGHKAAAGFTYTGTMDEALAELPALLDALVEEGRA